MFNERVVREGEECMEQQGVGEGGACVEGGEEGALMLLAVR